MVGPLVSLALQALSQELAVAADRLGLLAGPPLRGLLVIAPQLHFSEHPFALHFLLQGSERLIDIIVANEDLHGGFISITWTRRSSGRGCSGTAAIFSTSAALCEGGQRQRFTPSDGSHIF